MSLTLARQKLPRTKDWILSAAFAFPGPVSSTLSGELNDNLVFGTFVGGELSGDVVTEGIFRWWTSSNLTFILSTDGSLDELCVPWIFDNDDDEILCMFLFPVNVAGEIIFFLRPQNYSSTKSNFSLSVDVCGWLV